MKKYFIGAVVGAAIVAVIAVFAVESLNDRRMEFGPYSFFDHEGEVTVRGTLVGQTDGDPENNTHTLWCNEEQRICYDMWVENTIRKNVSHPMFQTYVVSSWGPEKVIAHTRAIAINKNECVFSEIELDRTFQTARMAQKPLEGAECRGGEETARPRQWEFSSGWNHPAVSPGQP